MPTKLKPETPLIAMLIAANLKDEEMLKAAMRAAVDVVKPYGFASFIKAAMTALPKPQAEWLHQQLEQQYQGDRQD